MVRFDRTVPAGGEGKISLKVKTHGFEGPIHKRVTIITDDPNNKTLFIALTAKIKPIISVKPRSVYLKGSKDQQIVHEMTIRGYEDLPLILHPEKFHLSDKVAYELKPIDTDKAFRLIVSNTQNHGGKYRGVLRIKTNYPDKPLLTIRIYGDITGNLRITPERVSFGLLDIARLKASQKKIVVRSLKLHSKEAVRIEKIEYNKELFELRQREIQPNRVYLIDVRLFVNKIVPGRLFEKVRIHTNLKDEPVLRVDVVGNAR